MKRGSLLTLPLMGIACAAHAQSSVTLYGVLDDALQYVNAQPKKAGSLTNLIQGGERPSRFGVTGTENLGDGVQAIFRLEAGIDPNSGTSTQGVLWGRYAYVGLASRYGTLMLGRNATPLYDFARLYDPEHVYNYGIVKQDAAFNDRADNAVKYTGQFGPFYTALLYSTSYSGAGEVAGQPKVGRAASAQIDYASGPFEMGAVAEQIFGSTVQTQNDRYRYLSIAANYKLGQAQAFLGFKNANANVSGRPTVNTLWWTGVNYSLSPVWKINDAVYYTDYSGTSSNSLTFAATVDYYLSKATNLYVSASYARNNGLANIGVNGLGTTDPGTNQTGVMVGISHLF
ncbi:porin [Pararobbsia alpina]|uniref:Outer membrane porin protein 32 n=1 Tax=Pararobbsia alpina TaxID=621374 RepID=A0A6S7BP49_9BURK|nr:porin [Pararobbsia alpina]CAB3797873.1 Outer membrane porin protein 32 [Pararobbsia alpina]